MPLESSATRVRFAALAITEVLGCEGVELLKLLLEPGEVHRCPLPTAVTAEAGRSAPLLLGPLHDRSAAGVVAPTMRLRVRKRRCRLSSAWAVVSLAHWLASPVRWGILGQGYLGYR